MTAAAQLDSVFPVLLRPINPAATPQQDYGLARVPGYGEKVDSVFPMSIDVVPPLLISYQDNESARILGIDGDEGPTALTHSSQLQSLSDYRNNNNAYASRKRSRPTSLLGLSRPTLPSELYKKRYHIENNGIDDVLLLKSVDQQEPQEVFFLQKNTELISESMNHKDLIQAAHVSTHELSSKMDKSTISLATLPVSYSSFRQDHHGDATLIQDTRSTEDDGCGTYDKNFKHASKHGLLSCQDSAAFLLHSDAHITPLSSLNHEKESGYIMAKKCAPFIQNSVRSERPGLLFIQNKRSLLSRKCVSFMKNDKKNVNSDMCLQRPIVLLDQDGRSANHCNDFQKKLQSYNEAQHLLINDTVISNIITPRASLDVICTNASSTEHKCVNQSIVKTSNSSVSDLVSVQMPLVYDSFSTESTRNNESKQFASINCNKKMIIKDNTLKRIIASTSACKDMDSFNQSNLSDKDANPEANQVSHFCFTCLSREMVLKCCNCDHFFCDSCCLISPYFKARACHACVELKTLRDRKPIGLYDTDASCCMSETAQRVCFDLQHHGLPFIVAADGALTKVEKSLLTQRFKLPQGETVVFALGPRFTVEVSRRDLYCCGVGIVWCVLTRGLWHMGQEELMFILQCEEAEENPPWDIFPHICLIAERVSRGIWISEFSVSIADGRFLDSDESIGFMFLRATFQCLEELPLCKPSCLIGLLILRDELSWAKLFPLRLMLGLGAQNRLYPSPLVSMRRRSSVFTHDTSQTVLNLFADFKNQSFTMPQVEGLSLLLSVGRAEFRFIRQRSCASVRHALSSIADDQLLAMRAEFCSLADSHLVAVQDENGKFMTQAISLSQQDHHLTGASFLVLNGGQSQNCAALVEDGLVVQLTAKEMACVLVALKEMLPLTLQCSSNKMGKTDDMVLEFVWMDHGSSSCTSIESAYFNVEKECTNEFDNVTYRFPFYHDDFSKALTRLRACSVRYLHHSLIEKPAPKVEVVKLARELGHVVLSVLEPIALNLLERGLGQVVLLVNFDSVKIDYEVGVAAFDFSDEMMMQVYSLPDDCLSQLENIIFPLLNEMADLITKAEPVILNMNFSLMDFKYCNCIIRL